jgi:hypothetical protein
METYGGGMETIIDRVVRAAGHYEGMGDGAESGAFSGVVEIRPVLDGLGAELTYRATAPDGSVLHVEHTLLALDMWSGEPTLFVLCSELNGLGQLVQSGESTFSNGRGTQGFELQIELDLGEDTLEYVWSWGAPGDDLCEQSRVVLTRAG